ncbi:antigen like protein, partial [Clarias magur]
AFVLGFMELTCVGSSPLSSISLTRSEVGLGAVLPCDWGSHSGVSPETPYIQWQTVSQMVFERMGPDQFQANAYKNRADVPERVLAKGNCSLHLNDIRFSDAGVYECYLVVGETGKRRRIFIQSVQLAVFDHKTAQSVEVGKDLALDLYTKQAETLVFQSSHSSTWTQLWQRQVTCNDSRVVERNRKLVIRNVTGSDEGLYKVMDADGLALSTVKVSVKDPPPTMKPQVLDKRISLEKKTTLCTSLAGIMTLLYHCILCVAVCVGSISAVPQATVSARLNSSVVLPCKLTDAFTLTSHVRWRADDEIVFERSSDGTSAGKGYEGRVDVPEDELRKGNCSLVLKNVSVADDGFYRTFVVEHLDKTNTDKIQEINRVILSVDALQISAHVGSTVILPCDWRDLSITIPHVEWYADNDIVFERMGKEAYPGESYEGRVDVPEDELRNGNCSLILKNVSINDAGVYRSSMVVQHPRKTVLVQKVQLSVYTLQISARVGSTVILPCDWRDLSIKIPHVKWYIDHDIVFERMGKEAYAGERYEGRVDVPEDELRKGNCSLVLKNFNSSDGGVYRSYMVEQHPRKSVLVQKLHLSVYKKSQILCMRLAGIMSLYICILCAAAIGFISAVPQVTLSARVGSTAILPCKLTDIFTKTSHVRWRANDEIVFERSSDGTSAGKGYEGRVDVPEDELRKGNCSLVLKNVSVADDGFYRTFVVEHLDKTNTDKIQEINRVELSVDEKPKDSEDNRSAHT